MTLKEKFENIIFNYIGSEWDRRDVSNSLEIETDEFAIEFAEWICEKAEVPYIKGKMDSTLEMFKKEKGL